ncbi:MAG TPA: S9 family peptidase [Gemmatimonadaceae bacterium]|jgi:dipeptidyl aminopeptidase/acylaminoacyl peptidase|nr:S9 family peptidase [Gemmatimonadaceae bacterium]
MRFVPSLASVLVVGLLGPALGAQRPKTIPVRDFFRNPEKAYFQVSQGGKYVSYTEPYQNRMNIVVRPVAGGEARRITSITDRDINAYGWKGDDRLFFFKDSGGNENFHLFAVDRAGTTQTDLTPMPKVRVNLVDELLDDPTDVLVEMNRRDSTVFDVYRVNVVTGDTTMIARNPGTITGWVADHHGRIRAALTTDGVNGTVLFRPTEADTFRVIAHTTFKDTFTPLFFTFDDQALYASSNLGRDKAAIVLFDPATGREREVLFQHPEVDVDGMGYSRKRKVPTEIDYVTWKQERRFLDPVTRSLYASLEKRLPGKEVFVTFMNRDEDVMIVRTMSDRSLGSYYLYQRAGDRLTKLADRNPWLDERDLAPMKPISYTSRDGLTIHGYLTLPLGVAPRHLPVVVNPHGGPWARDQWGFNPEVQFLANRGYAVLQVNFRGSTGYGRKFFESSFKQWGRTMQDDVSDGVKWLIGQGIADSSRVAIYGGSYGGYATLAGLAFSPELYAAGIDYVGVSNLFTFMKTIPPYWKPFLDQIHEMVGNPERDSVALAAASPVFHVDRIRAPLLVAQGAKDPRVNIDESNQIVEALRKRGIDVQYIVKENEGHGFQNEENRFEFYEAMERFLARHVTPAGAKPVP